MHKLSHFQNGDWVAHSFAPVFAQETTDAGTERIVAGVPGGDPTVFEQLVCGLELPCALLYVLHTPRGEGQPGRYQSPELNSEQLRSFIERFGPYFSADARFDIWAHSARERTTVVWERHNLLYGYGAIDRFGSQLLAMGFHTGKAVIPSPHQHHYRSDWDTQAAAVLAEFNWSVSPLRAEDEQFATTDKK
jgi:hypothetical protein